MPPASFLAGDRGRCLSLSHDSGPVLRMGPRVPASALPRYAVPFHVSLHMWFLPDRFFLRAFVFRRVTSPGHSPIFYLLFCPYLSWGRPYFFFLAHSADVFSPLFPSPVLRLVGPRPQREQRLVSLEILLARLFGSGFGFSLPNHLLSPA